MIEIKTGNGEPKTIFIENETLFPNPTTIRKADLARITFEWLNALKSDVERLEKRLKKLEKDL